jgi:hypothetical protein
MLSLTRLKSILDTRFGPPFLRRGHVKTHWVRPKAGRPRQVALSITIGRRNIWIEPDGSISASGTDVTRKG